MTTSPDSDLFLLLLRRWRTLAVVMCLAVAASVGYALFAPKWYEARIQVMQSQRSHESAAMTLAANLPGALDTLSTDVQRIEAVLSSTTVTDAVIDHLRLDQYYGTSYREETRELLWKHCNTATNLKAGLVTLTCEDRKPEMAMRIAEYFGEVGNNVFGRVSGSAAREEEKFLEKQVAKVRSDVETASQRLRAFQEKNKIVDLSEQSRAVLSAMASMKGELLSKQLELSYLTSFSSRGEAKVVQLQQQIAILDEKLKQMEHSAMPAASQNASGSGAKADFFPDALDVPELREELENLVREQKTQEALFSLITQRYEMARVEAARDTPTLQILDHATLPTFRARPKRRMVVVVGAGGGALVALSIVLLPQWWRRRMARA